MCSSCFNDLGFLLPSKENAACVKNANWHAPIEITTDLVITTNVYIYPLQFAKYVSHTWAANLRKHLTHSNLLFFSLLLPGMFSLNICVPSLQGQTQNLPLSKRLVISMLASKWDSSIEKGLGKAVCCGRYWFQDWYDWGPSIKLKRGVKYYPLSIGFI